MRVLLGITKSNFGGAQRYVFDLAQALKHDGHHIKVVLGGNGTLVEKLDRVGVPVIHVPSFGRDINPLDDFLSFLFLIETLYNERAHVFHVNSSKMGALGVLAARVMGTPHIVFTVHGWAFNEKRPAWQKMILKTLYWFTILLSHTTICVSEKTKQDIASWPFIQKKLKVIHNGIEPLDLLPRDEAKKKLHLTHNLVVGTIAELHPIKGLHTLLKAWKEVLHTDAQLVILGAGEEKQNLEVQAKESGITDRVTFAGFIDNAASYLSAFEVFVLPSYSEGLPYVVLEAGAASRPVIASQVGGIPEIIHENEGILVEPGNVEKITEALTTLLEDEALRKTYGDNLRTRIATEFTRDRMVRDTLKAYE